MNTLDISTIGLSLAKWTMTKRNDPRPVDGHTITGFYSLSHTHNDIPELVMARFFLGERELHRAWGWKEDKYCSYHLLLVSSEPKATAGCPPMRIEHTENSASIVYNTDPIITIPVTIIS